MKLLKISERGVLVGEAHNHRFEIDAKKRVSTLR